MSKLMIVEERDSDKYEYQTRVRCWACEPSKGALLPESSEDAHTKQLIQGVMQSLSSARQSEIKAWEEEITACEHTLMLEQYATGPIKAEGASRLIAFGTGHVTELYHSR